jgi:hypothetical protein
MLHIRPEQMKVLDDHMVRKFEDLMVTHLNKYFPEHCKNLGEDGTRKSVRQAIKHAGSYGIVSERDICVYIDVMFEFGRNFDKNPRLPWASKILNDEVLEGLPTDKVGQLYDAAVENLEQARGIEPETEV